MEQRGFRPERQGSVSVWNDVSMRIEFRISEDCRDPLLKTLRNEMLKPLGFLMHLIPRVIEHIVQK